MPNPPTSFLSIIYPSTLVFLETSERLGYLSTDLARLHQSYLYAQRPIIGVFGSLCFKDWPGILANWEAHREAHMAEAWDTLAYARQFGPSHPPKHSWEEVAEERALKIAEADQQHARRNYPNRFSEPLWPTPGNRVDSTRG